MTDPIPRVTGPACPPWCEQHTVTGSFVHHCADVGTATAQGAPITVHLIGSKPLAGGPGSASVAVRWEPIGDQYGGTQDEPLQVDGFDLTAVEAGQLAGLLARGAALLTGQEVHRG